MAQDFDIGLADYPIGARSNHDRSTTALTSRTIIAGDRIRSFLEQWAGKYSPLFLAHGTKPVPLQ
jgi:hypothetical protein